MSDRPNSLILLACSSTKKSMAAPALDLYQGVMYQTFRRNVLPAARPHVIILSALHGFIPADQVVEPYNLRMTAARADELLENLGEQFAFELPIGVTSILLAGGKEYRRVMRAALPALLLRGCITKNATISETSGGIGYQRQQLGAFLCGPASAGEVIGHHPNGTLLYQSLGGFSTGQTVGVAYRSRPDLPARPARIEELFNGPSGATACVRILDAKKQDRAHRWVSLRDLQAIQA